MEDGCGGIITNYSEPINTALRSQFIILIDDIKQMIENRTRGINLINDNVTKNWNAWSSLQSIK